MWQGILGQDEVVEQFRLTLKSGRLASTYLFVGPSGIGKRRFALKLAHALLCTESPDVALAPCGQCESCRMFAAGSHPDVRIVQLRPDKAQLAISQFVGYDDVLEAPALCPWLSLKPFFGGRRIAIVDDADHFNNESANCLLKTLEEPPPQALLILIGTSAARQLPTIRSRAAVVRFQPLDQDTVVRILVEQRLIADRQQAAHAAALSEGSVEQALQSAEPELWQFRGQLQKQLHVGSFDHVRLARAIQAFVEEAGKESARRRGRLRAVIGFAIELFREQLRGDAVTDAESVVESLDVSLAALEHVDRNVNLATLIAWWMSELARCRTAAV